MPNSPVLSPLAGISSTRWGWLRRKSFRFSVVDGVGLVRHEGELPKVWEIGVGVEGSAR